MTNVSEKKVVSKSDRFTFAANQACWNTVILLRKFKLGYTATKSYGNVVRAFGVDSTSERKAFLSSGRYRE